MNNITEKEGEAMYRAVIFYFDGTLIDSETHLFEVMNKQLIKYGAEPVSKAFYQRSIGGGDRRASRLLDASVRRREKS